jgi:hypothetical protein
MAKNPTPAKPRTFKHETRWAVIFGGELFDMRAKEKDARELARIMYADQKTYAAALRTKAAEVLKVDIRPAKKK